MTKHFRPFCFWVLTCVCLLSIGCGPTHQRVPAVQAGRPLHLVVSIPKKHALDASGTLHVSLPTDSGVFTPQPMQRQGRDLYTTIDTYNLLPGDRVQYYFEILAGGEATSLGSAQRPFVTDVLDRTGLILASINTGVRTGPAGQPITFFLETGGFKAAHPIVRYAPPNLPGVVELAMEWKQWRWETTVPGQHVAPGAWSYRIEARVEDIHYANPAEPDTWLYFTIPAKH